ncbi:hypothetical protein ACS78_08265 [Priestia megaterium]|uniref:phage holin n=1 Tax=Priestia megaterium TaxID=1404 RepID=UPI0006809DFE|nr:phage holin [Priestia megaterium]KNH23936.1 hypothetical protein ACS78_08265 [Priestia megaterium]
MKKIDKGTFIRTVLLFIALLNQVLVACNQVPLPLTEEQIEGTYTLISVLFTSAAAGWAWFSNNYLTEKGHAQKEILKRNGLK